MNAYGQLHISAPDPNSFAQWRVDGWANEPISPPPEPPMLAPAEPPEHPRDGSMFGLNRSTDETRLAGQRLGHPATVVDSARILRELYPDGRIAEQVYAASPAPSISAGFRAGRQTGRSLTPSSIVGLWEAEMRSNREAVRRMLDCEIYGISYHSGQPQVSNIAIDSLPPERVMHAEASMLRKMDGR